MLSVDKEDLLERARAFRVCASFTKTSQCVNVRQCNDRKGREESLQHLSLRIPLPVKMDANCARKKKSQG